MLPPEWANVYTDNVHMSGKFPVAAAELTRYLPISIKVDE